MPLEAQIQAGEAAQSNIHKGKKVRRGHPIVRRLISGHLFVSRWPLGSQPARLDSGGIWSELYSRERSATGQRQPLPRRPEYTA